MKKLVLATLLSATILSCGDKKKEETPSATPEKTSSEELFSKEEETVAKELKKGADLIAASDCLACHKTDEKLVGPSYKEVAAKYTEKDIDLLVTKIIEGGKGNWGEVPMTPHPAVSKEDATEMVKYILSLK
jgi:cytochrome c